MQLCRAAGRSDPPHSSTAEADPRSQRCMFTGTGTLHARRIHGKQCWKSLCFSRLVEWASIHSGENCRAESLWSRSELTTAITTGLMPFALCVSSPITDLWHWRRDPLVFTVPAVPPWSSKPHRATQAHLRSHFLLISCLRTRIILSYQSVAQWLMQLPWWTFRWRINNNRDEQD